MEALIADDGFWAVQAHSLAIFATPERIRTFRLPNRLVSVVEVADRFHIKPLLRAVTFPHNAYVLAIGMGGGAAGRGRRRPAAARGQGAGAAQGHGGRARPAQPRRAHRRGHDAASETSEHALLTRYARAVDQALRPVLAGHGRPLIVAAAEPLASVYRAVSTYPHTAAEVIGGAADRTPTTSWPRRRGRCSTASMRAAIAELATLFVSREPQGRAVTDVAQAARAATFGAVDTLIVDMDAVVAGTVDDETAPSPSASRRKAETYGVVDEIARRTLLAGGRVVSARRADMPGGGDLAAILRYPV